MVGASVPEAAVDEDGDAFRGEYNIGSSPNGWDWAGIYAIAEAIPVKHASNCKFRFGIA